MAIPVNAQDQIKPKAPTVNLPKVQPGQDLPMHPSAVQQPPVQQPQPLQPQATPLQRQLPPQAPVPSFSPEQAAALAQQPVPTPQPQPDSQPTPGIQNVVDPTQSADVIQTAQQKALTGFQSPESDLLNQRVNELLQDPSLGRNPDLARQIAMDEFDKNRAGAIEAFRQQTGAIAGSGNIDELLLSKSLEAAEGRTALERQMELEDQELKKTEMFDALAAGTTNVQLQQAIQTGDINNLINAAGGALGFADLAMRENIALSDQDFTLTRDQFAREHDLALQSNDENKARSLLQKQLDFETQQASLGREFTSEQSALTRSLQESLAHLTIDGQKEFLGLKAKVDEGLLLTELDWKGAENALAIAAEKALADKSVEATFALQNAQNEFNELLSQQQQSWTTAERQATEAWQTGENVNQQEFGKAMQLLQMEETAALQNDDQAHVARMQESQNQLQLHMLTQNMGHDEKMAYLNTEMQSNLNQEQFAQQDSLLQQQAVIDTNLTNLDAQIKNAQAIGDFARVRILQAEQQSMDIEMARINEDIQTNMQGNVFLQEKQLQDDQQIFQKELTDVNAKIQEAQINQNFELESQLVEQKGLIEQDLLQTQAEITTAQASEQFGYQKTLLQMQTVENIKVMAEQGQLDQALANLQGEIQKEINAGNHSAAKELQGIQHQQEMKIHVDNMSMQKMFADMEAFGIKTDVIQQQINAGNLSPEAALDNIKSQYPDFEIQLPDPMAIQKALEEDFLNQQYQYALTQGTDADGNLTAGEYDANGNFTGLNSSFNGTFNNHLNSTIYDQEGSPIEAAVIALKAGETDISTITGMDDPVYQALKNDISVPTMFVSNDFGGIGETGSGKSGRKTFPSLENNRFVEFNDVIYEVTSQSTKDRPGNDDTNYVITNILNGKSETITASRQSRYMDGNLGNLGKTF